MANLPKRTFKFTVEYQFLRFFYFIPLIEAKEVPDR